MKKLLQNTYPNNQKRNLRIWMLDKELMRNGLSRTRWYGEEVSESATKYSAKSSGRVSGSARKQTTAVRRLRITLALDYAYVLH